MTGRSAGCALTFSVGGVNNFILEGIGVCDEKSNRHEEKDDANDKGKDEYVFEGLEGEPGFVAEPFEAALGLVILHLKVQIKLT